MIKNLLNFSTSNLKLSRKFTTLNLLSTSSFFEYIYSNSILLF